MTDCWAAYLDWRDRFSEAVDPRLYPLEYIDGLVASGAVRLWAGEAAAIMAEIRVYPSKARVLVGRLAAGDINEIQDILIPQAEQWGRENGCVLALIEGRKGWGRVMKKHGYGPFVTVVEKEL